MDIISPILTVIFNTCIVEGTFPDLIKLAEIVPIFKSGSKTSYSNYRPISLLSPFAKIFESYIYFQLDDFLTKHNVIYNMQYGFRQQSSTELAVNHIVDDLSNCIDNKMVNCSVFLDLAKAFNTVDHCILIKKLEKCGVRGIALEIFKSFLAKRKQFTTVNGQKSTAKHIETGVPQGSTLGPLLFLVYINDLPFASTMKVRLFADDACLSVEHKNPETLELIVNKEPLKVQNWLDNNKLFINYSKSNFLIFTKRKLSHQFKIKLGNLI